MDPLASTVVLGFVLGVQHATDPDHLVAVATIVTRERRFADGALIGALWGVGHLAALALAGAIIIGFRLAVLPQVATGLELLVAAMLVILGILRLRDVARGVEALPAEHDHGGVEVVHSHAHAHDGRVHDHPHVHPSRRLLAAIGGDRRRLAARAVGIGAVHGMAGSAAVSLLVLATLPTATGATAYLFVFGAGTIIGMTALTAVMAYPVALAARLRRARTALAVSAGVGSIAFGIAHAVAAI